MPHGPILPPLSARRLQMEKYVFDLSALAYHGDRLKVVQRGCFKTPVGMLTLERSHKPHDIDTATESQVGQFKGRCGDDRSWQDERRSSRREYPEKEPSR